MSAEVRTPVIGEQLAQWVSEAVWMACNVYAAAGLPADKDAIERAFCEAIGEAFA